MATEWSPFDDLGNAMKPPPPEEPPTNEDLLKALDSPGPRNLPMEEITMNIEYKATKDLSDLGTRYNHLSDLLVMWEDTVDMMAQRSFLGRDELFKKAGIELAIKQLKKTIEGMQGYREYVGGVRDMINHVPKAFAIFGGRGASLSRPFEPWVEDKHEEMT